MATQTNMIIIGAIGLAIIVALVLVFRNFDFKKITEDVSKGIEEFANNAGKGLEEFANNAGKGFDEFSKNTNEGISDLSENVTKGLDSIFNPQTKTPQEREALDVFNRQVEEKKQQALSFGFSNVAEFERATDTNRDPLKFNPPNIIGFGFPNVNDGRGIPDTPENREILDDLIAGKATFNTQSNQAEFADVFNFPQIPEAFAEEPPETQTVIQFPSADRPISLSQFAKTSKRPQPKTKTATVRGTTRSELDTDQVFETFGQNTDNRKVTGVIRETPKNPAKLRTNSKKQPLETASQRANRVFEETGKFADEDRGLGVTSAKDKTRDFNFGTNTSSALKKPTTGSNAKARLEERKRLAEQNALAVFDSGAISNF